jgi:hypothetical protein
MRHHQAEVFSFAWNEDYFLSSPGLDVITFASLKMNKITKRPLILLTILMQASCSTYKTQVVPNPEAPRFFSANDRKLPRQIEVYFDGTANDWAARTNVRRRFEVAAQAEDPFRPCLYIEGVGTDSLTGKIFGVGMKSRVLTAYKFLARNRRPATTTRSEDSLLIFGFSRGAFQARMLAGLMAHCGLPHLCSGRFTPEQEKSLDQLAEDVWKYCEDNLVDLTQKEVRAGGPDAWRRHLADNRRKLQEALSPSYPGVTWTEPTIKLLAIWDTVPGLSFTKLSEMGEPEKGHQRYKVAAYPNIQTIVHALSLDDQRSKFEPLPVGAPIDPVATNVYEVWFPGAHSDVGGGYGDSNDMAGTSYNWLHRIMNQRGIATRKTVVYEDPNALMHHPEEQWIHRLTSDSLPRRLPAGSHIDRSAFRRADGNAHPEENRSKYVIYSTTNRIANGPTKGQVLDVSRAGKNRADQEAYLKKLGLVFHDDTGATLEKALAEKGVQPLSISQMAAAWNEKPETIVPEPEAKTR